ncbi:hypothetical protein, partial [Burkholderia sp. SIMBA_048]|uniref:hypothetical protein n=1 Tax=Burkholderia sp. SIMBA_048 TaxID=3085789 RepID=UPI003979859B
LLFAATSAPLTAQQRAASFLRNRLGQRAFREPRGIRRQLISYQLITQQHTLELKQIYMDSHPHRAPESGSGARDNAPSLHRSLKAR